jgi:F420-dependent oxidoreductase-like protein
MKIGLQINRFTWKGQPESISETLAKVAKTADEVGFQSIWVMDHFFQIGYIGKPQEPMLESYNTLGFLAAQTKKAKLGTMVSGVIYRHPALLVKAVTTLDVLSQGRAYLGIGAAWNEEESMALGFNFPPVKERFEILEETLQIALNMWSENPKPFKGAHFQMENPINSPRALSKPHPEILIGGGGERKTLRLVAQYANACNLFNTPDLEHKLEVLKEHCIEVGRNYDEIEKTVMSRVGTEDGPVNPEQFIEECKRLKGLGISHVITSIRTVEEISPLEVFREEIIPEVSSL